MVHGTEDDATLRDPPPEKKINQISLPASKGIHPEPDEKYHGPQAEKPPKYQGRLS